MTRRFWAGWSVVFTLLATGAGCHREAPKQAASPAPVLTVSTEPAALGSISQGVELTGSVDAWDRIAVSPGVSGLLITEVLADEGQTVKKGQLLARLNDEALQAQLAAARARAANAQAALASAQDAARRFGALAKEGGVSASELITRQTAANQAAAQLAEARAAIRQLEVQVGQARVTAPADGMIITRDAHIGDVAAVGKPLFTIVRDNRLQLEALAPEADLARIRPGQSAVISSDAMPGQRVTGRVRQIQPALNATSRQGTVEIDLPPGSGFRVGMFARARVNLGTQAALTVPANAVVNREQGPAVFVFANGEAQLRPVALGPRAGDRVAVVNGLRPGEPVIINGVGFLKDGDRVDVANTGGGAGPGASPEARP